MALRSVEIKGLGVKITFEGDTLQQVVPEYFGPKENIALVKSLLHFSFGMDGHLIRVDTPVKPYDFEHALKHRLDITVKPPVQNQKRTPETTLY